MKKFQVAIKIIRKNDMMKKAAQKEIEVLKRINRHREGRRTVVYLMEHFEHHGHICMVFESMCKAEVLLMKVAFHKSVNKTRSKGLL